MSNPFVATTEYCEAIQKALNHPHWARAAVNLEFETDPAFLRELLPPCFDMPEEPKGNIFIGKFQSTLGDEYDCASISFNACYRHYRHDATYTVVLYISPDMPVIYGRECWGEAKKLGFVQMYKCGTDLFAYAERNGVRIIELEGAVGQDEGPFEGTPYFNLTVKCTPHARGYGFQSAPLAVVKENVAHHRVMMHGTGTVRLIGTALDPLDAIPIVSLGQLTYSESKTESWIVECDALKDPDAYLPYFYGVAYDNYQKMRIGKIFD